MKQKNPKVEIRTVIGYRVIFIGLFISRHMLEVIYVILYIDKIGYNL